LAKAFVTVVNVEAKEVTVVPFVVATVDMLFIAVVLVLESEVAAGSGGNVVIVFVRLVVNVAVGFMLTVVSVLEMVSMVWLVVADMVDDVLASVVMVTVTFTVLPRIALTKKEDTSILPKPSR